MRRIEGSQDLRGGINLSELSPVSLLVLVERCFL